MNLRKSSCSSKQKRILPCKNIKSSVRRGKESSTYAQNSKYSSKNLSKTLARSKKSDLDDSALGVSFTTSTPISAGVGKRVLRSPGKYDSNKVFNQNSLKITSCSTPNENFSMQVKPCEVRMIHLKNINKSKPVKVLTTKIRSLSSSVESVSKNVRSTRNSMVMQSQIASKKMPNDNKNSHSEESKYARHISISSQKKHLGKRRKSEEEIIVPQNKTCAKKLSFPISSTPKSTSSISNKLNELSIEKKSLDGVSQTPKDSLLLSYHEIDNTKFSRYSLRNSAVSQKKSYSKRKSKNKKKSSTHAETLAAHLSSTPKPSASAKLSAVKKKNALDAEISQNSQNILSGSNNKIDTSKPSRYSLRLQKQQSREKASGNKNTKRAFGCTSLDKGQLPKEATKNKSMPRSSSQHSVKKNSAKKQKLAKKVHQPDKTSSSSKKKKSTKKSTNKFQREYSSFSGNIPVDDLALSIRPLKTRKVKSDTNFNYPGKSTLKRKISAIDAINKADEDYEDDIYDPKQFDKFKALFMDTSDSEMSFTISTPRFPKSTPRFPITTPTFPYNSPIIRQKTPKIKDSFSPREYAISRKAALEYIYRNRNKKNVKKPETPVIPEKKKLGFSQVLENVSGLQKTVEKDEESDNDSYFSFT